MKLRTLLTEEARRQCDAGMAQRYLRATSFNPVKVQPAFKALTESVIYKAAQRIEDSVKWRQEWKPECLICKSCAQDPGSVS